MILHFIRYFPNTKLFGLNLEELPISIWCLMGEGSPLNIFGGIPLIATDYSSLWVINLGKRTQEAINNGYRSSEIRFQILGLVENGWITGPDGAPFGSAEIIVNHPMVFRLL